MQKKRAMRRARHVIFRAKPAISANGALSWHLCWQSGSSPLGDPEVVTAIAIGAAVLIYQTLPAGSSRTEN